MTTLRAVLVVAAVMVALALLRYKPWQRTDTPVSAPTRVTEARPQLAVGFLPVT